MKAKTIRDTRRDHVKERKRVNEEQIPPLPFTAQHSVEAKREGRLLHAVLSWFKPHLTPCVLWGMAHPLPQADRPSNGLSGMARLERKQGQKGQRRWCLIADSFWTFWLKIHKACSSNCLWGKKKMDWQKGVCRARSRHGASPTDSFHGLPSCLTNLARVSKGRCVLLQHGTSSVASELMRVSALTLCSLCVNTLLLFSSDYKNNI